MVGIGGGASAEAGLDFSSALADNKPARVLKTTPLLLALSGSRLSQIRARLECVAKLIA